MVGTPGETGMFSEQCRCYWGSAHLASTVFSGIETCERPLNTGKFCLGLREHLASPLEHRTIAGETVKRLVG